MVPSSHRVALQNGILKGRVPMIRDQSRVTKVLLPERSVLTAAVTPVRSTVFGMHMRSQMPLSLGAITSAKAIVEQRTVEFSVERTIAKKGCVNSLV
jgi:hypothetical protein